MIKVACIARFEEGAESTIMYTVRIRNDKIGMQRKTNIRIRISMHIVRFRIYL